MDNLNTQIRTKILDFLRTKTIGASSSEIAKQIGHNRITVTKYLEIMKAHKLLTYEDIAQAKIWQISDKRDKPTILIVDDEPNVVDLVALSLISNQYKIIKAYSGLDGLEKIYHETPDLIVLDLMMPGLNGFEVCKRLKESALTQHIPIIILSAKGQLNDKLEGMKMGADDYITKPFDPLELEARVNVMLRRIKQDFDTHPLSLLPGMNSLKAEIIKKQKSKNDFIVISFKISGLENYKTEFGFKNSDDTILLISRMFANVIKSNQNSFISHTIKDEFIIVGKKDIDKEIKQSFDKLLPYIYSNKKPKTELKLKFKKISGKKLETIKFDDLCESLNLSVR